MKIRRIIALSRSHSFVVKEVTYSILFGTESQLFSMVSSIKDQFSASLVFRHSSLEFSWFTFASESADFRFP
jgi:hypothetical protein